MFSVFLGKNRKSPTNLQSKHLFETLSPPSSVTSDCEKFCEWRLFCYAMKRHDSFGRVSQLGVFPPGLFVFSALRFSAIGLTCFPGIFPYKKTHKNLHPHEKINVWRWWNPLLFFWGGVNEPTWLVAPWWPWPLFPAASLPQGLRLPEWCEYHVDASEAGFFQRGGDWGAPKVGSEFWDPENFRELVWLVRYCSGPGQIEIDRFGNFVMMWHGVSHELMFGKVYVS